MGQFGSTRQLVQTFQLFLTNEIEVVFQITCTFAVYKKVGKILRIILLTKVYVKAVRVSDS